MQMLFQELGVSRSYPVKKRGLTVQCIVLHKTLSLISSASLYYVNFTSNFKMEILFMYSMFLILINSFQLCFASVVSHWVNQKS